MPETGHFELLNGVIVEMQPTGPHKQVVGLLNRKLSGFQLAVNQVIGVNLTQ